MRSSTYPAWPQKMHRSCAGRINLTLSIIHGLTASGLSLPATRVHPLRPRTTSAVTGLLKLTLDFPVGVDS